MLISYINWVLLESNLWRYKKASIAFRYVTEITLPKTLKQFKFNCTHQLTEKDDYTYINLAMLLQDEVTQLTIN